MMKLGKFVDVLDVVNQASFYLLVMNISRTSGGSKRGIFFEMHVALTTLPCLASDFMIRLPQSCTVSHLENILRNGVIVSIVYSGYRAHRLQIDATHRRRPLIGCC
jgi:hypothetical protein